ncbi:MAG: hypothetical protein ACK4HV_01010, partial [Parachlamydiaceae bacterium]
MIPASMTLKMRESLEPPINPCLEEDASKPLSLFQIPYEKLKALSLEDFIEAVRLYPEDKCEAFFKEISVDHSILIRNRFLEPLLAILITKANNLDATLSRKGLLRIVTLPPLLLLLAIKLGMDLVSLSRYFSLKQIRFLAEFAEDGYLNSAIDFLIKNQCDVKFFTLLKNIRSEAVYQRYVHLFDNELNHLEIKLEYEVKEIKKIKEEIEERKIKSGVKPSFSSLHFLTEKEKITLSNAASLFSEDKNLVNSFIFQAMI